MVRVSFIASGLLALVLVGGCVVHARTGAHVSSPDLVMVSPGVYVIADYHEPVFYSNGYYWLYRDGYWMRSSYHSGGWVQVRTVPVGVRRIDRPRTYVRYRASGQVYRRDRSGRVIQHRGPTRVRDHRSTPAHRPAARPGHRPAARDHRSTPAQRPAHRPAARDHRSTPAQRPAARDHRKAPARAPARDHRRGKDKDKDKDKDRRR
jgi:hypothetical protein